MLIKRLRVMHFKSIRRLDLCCLRVNLFIGEPNTGKSKPVAVMIFSLDSNHSV